MLRAHADCGPGYKGRAGHLIGACNKTAGWHLRLEGARGKTVAVNAIGDDEGAAAKFGGKDGRNSS